MMRVLNIFLLIFVNYCSGLSLPTKLKCVDAACKINISTGRTIDHTKTVFGDLKEIRKSALVNIKGKSVSNDEYLWLIEFEGLYGFVEFKTIKENAKSAITALELVSNPYHSISDKEADDETGYDENAHDMKLFSNTDDINKVGKNDDEILENSNVKNFEDQALTTDATDIQSPSSPIKTSTKPKIPDLITIDSESDNKIGSNNFNGEKSGRMKEGLLSSISQTDIVDENSMVKKEETYTGKSNTDSVEGSAKLIEESTNSSKLNANSIDDITVENKGSSHTGLNIKYSKMEKKMSSSKTKLNEDSAEVNARKSDIIKDVNDVKKRNILIPLRDSDPWFAASDGRPADTIGERLNKIRSPILIILLKVEQFLYLSTQSFIKRTGLDSCFYFKEFVQKWLFMSLENFIMILSLLSALFMVVYTPKMLRLKRNWQWECENQSHLVVELEAQMQSMDAVRLKMSLQNDSLEIIIADYKDRLKIVGEEAAIDRMTVESDLERTKKSNEDRILRLKKELLASIEQCKILEALAMERECSLDALNAEVHKMRYEFKTELSMAQGASEVLETRLLEVHNLRTMMDDLTLEKLNLVKDKDNLSKDVTSKNDEINMLNGCLRELKIFEGQSDDEYKSTVHHLLESMNFRVQLKEAEDRLYDLRIQLEGAVIQIRSLEEGNKHSEDLAKEYEDQRCEAVKDREAAELKLRVLTEYFREKEVEMQRNLGHESVEKSHSIDQGQSYKNKMENLESENESLMRTIQKLKLEVKESQSYAVKCKNDANTQIANAFLNISNLERDLMKEKDESRKLRSKLSHYVGPSTSWNTTPNHTKERPTGVSETGGGAPRPPIFPLSMLPYTVTPVPPTSGRNSSSSISKKSNNS